MIRLGLAQTLLTDAARCPAECGGRDGAALTPNAALSTLDGGTLVSGIRETLQWAKGADAIDAAAVMQPSPPTAWRFSSCSL
jgi:hypothetical protein